jgi:uncharacterized membrane protein YjjP (DUF1212 family)
MKNGYTNMKSSLWFGESIPHYYGDYVRAFFIAMAGLSFVVTPLWGDLLPFGVVAQVAASLLLVLLAGLTSPRGYFVMIANATVAAVSILLLESAAIILRTLGPNATQLFMAREAGVLLLLGALYFSVKTIRAMMAGKLGHMDSPLEFTEDEESFEKESTMYQHQDISDYNE